MLFHNASWTVWILLKVMLVFFFWLGSCQLGWKVFHWERKFCLFLVSTVFSILEICIYSNGSVLLVFLCSFFVFFSFPKGQAWVFDFRNQALARLLSKNDRLWISRTAANTLCGHFQGRGVLLARCRSSAHPSVFLVDSAQPGTHAWSVVTPDFLIRKGKKKTNKKMKKKFFKKSLGYLVLCTVAIFSSKIKLYKLWARFIRKRHLLLTRDF